MRLPPREQWWGKGGGVPPGPLPALADGRLAPVPGGPGSHGICGPAGRGAGRIRADDRAGQKNGIPSWALSRLITRLEQL